jgi:hypothetical protein
MQSGSFGGVGSKVGDRSKIEAGRAWMREQVANGFKNFQRSDWRDVAKCSFCGQNGHQVEQLIAGGGKTAGGQSVMICDQCIDVCAQMVADRRAGKP